jgi:F0F1-type ATP synthase membrane subunit b/b'
MAIEKRIVVKEGYEGFHAEAISKLASVEETARAKVEELIRDDKERLQNIINVSTEEIEVEVPDVVEETAEMVEDGYTAE